MLEAAKRLGVSTLPALVLATALSAPASAHKTWANGLPVPEWVSKACCGPADAHHLSASQVYRVQNGYRINGYAGTIYDVQVLPSEDGEYWAFYKETLNADGQPAFTSVFCFFAPAWD